MKILALTSITLIVLLSISCTGMRKEEAFWKWFRENEARLFDFEQEREKIFDELTRELKKVNPDLVFEFGPKNEKRDFTVSADGIKESFPAVIALVDKAPPLERWNILKFRQRGKPVVNIRIDGEELSTDQYKFTIEPDGQKTGITLYIDGYEQARHNLFAKVGFLFLDNCLGEYDMETKVGFVEFKPAAEPSSLPKQPLSELPETFDKFTSAKLN